MSAAASDTQSETQTGHGVASSSVVADDAVDPQILAFQEHQATAAKLSLAEEARTLVNAATWGMISTLGSGGAAAGYPCGSVVEYASEESGALVFAFSSMSSHTTDARKQGKASLTIPTPNFQGLQDARVSLTGDIAAVEGQEAEELRGLYRQRHPNSYWVDFGDFSIFRLVPRTGRLIGGFARAGQITAEEYSSARPDPIAPFSAAVAQHMNQDHEDATLAIVRNVAGITCSGAQIAGLDRLGMTVRCRRGEETFKARIPFSRPVEDRKAIKDVIVEMTRAAKA